MTGETRAIEHEAAETRDRIADTIDELQARLSPKALVDNALGSLGTAGSSAVDTIRGAASGHPLALGAAGLAIGIALLARSRVQRATVEYGDSYAAYADYDDGYAANLADATPGVSRTRKHLDAFQHEAHATVDDNPFAVVAVGLATGVLLGAVIPVSDVEHHLFGEVRGRVAAAGDAAVAAVRHEFQHSKLSLKGGSAGLTQQLTELAVKIMHEATGALGTPVTGRSARQP